MKKKGDIVMKKTAALLTAVMILIAASGCGGGKDTGKSIVMKIYRHRKQKKVKVRRLK